MIWLGSVSNLIKIGPRNPLLRIMKLSLDSMDTHNRTTLDGWI